MVIKGGYCGDQAYPYLDKYYDLYHMYIAAAPPGMNP